MRVKGYYVSIVAVLFIVLTYPVGLLWHLFDTPENATKKWDWFYNVEMQVDPAWMIKLCSDEIINLMIAVAFLIATWKNVIYRGVLIEYTLYRFLELCFWFYNFKTVHYNYIYFVVFALGLTFWYYTFKTKK